MGKGNGSKKLASTKKRRLLFNNPAQGRRTMVRITGDYYEGRLSSDRAKTLGYLCKIILGYLRLEADIRIEGLLEELKALATESIEARQHHVSN